MDGQGGSWRQRNNEPFRGQRDYNQADGYEWRSRPPPTSYPQDRYQGQNYDTNYYNNEQTQRDEQWQQGGWGHENPPQPRYDQYYQPNYPPPAAPPSSSSNNTGQTYGRPTRDPTYPNDPYDESNWGGYTRRAYRPNVVLSDMQSDTVPSSPQRRYHSFARSDYKEKKSSFQRSKPRQSYHLRTLEAPSNFPTDVEPPGPIPLLVLDLNGTLVNRGARADGNTTERSKRPQLRPYLKSFLQYCLGIQRTDATMEEHQDAWDEWEYKSSKKKRFKGPHGAQFWSSDTPPRVQPGAKFRLLLWSSAQPHNVDSMARAILSPQQAEQLVRVYARDTLVTKRLYSQKAPSIKDLEILWTVLNSNSIGMEAEARLLAEARDREDEQDPDEEGKGSELSEIGAANGAAKKAQASVVLPQKDDNDRYRNGAGYGQHNTLLLDDSVDKAKLQPFNHILLPEFDAPRASSAARAMRKGEKEKGSADSSSETSSDRASQKDQVDDVLLQVVGVLEHARYQKNISSWVRFGGLGDFGGMQKQHPYFLEEEEENESGIQVAEELIEEAFLYFTQPLSSHPTSGGPRLNAVMAVRDQEFWAEEGRTALQRHGIPIQKF